MRTKKDILQKMLMELTWMNTQLRDIKSELNEIIQKISKPQEIKK